MLLFSTKVKTNYECLQKYFFQIINPYFKYNDIVAEINQG